MIQGNTQSVSLSIYCLTRARFLFRGDDLAFEERPKSDAELDARIYRDFNECPCVLCCSRCRPRASNRHRFFLHIAWLESIETL